MLNDIEQGRDGLIAHGASIVSLVRGLRGSLGHVVGYRVKSGAKGCAKMAELSVMAKHMHAHVYVPGRGLVRRMKPHCNGALIVHVLASNATSIIILVLARNATSIILLVLASNATCIILFVSNSRQQQQQHVVVCTCSPFRLNSSRTRCQGKSS